MISVTQTYHLIYKTHTHTHTHTYLLLLLGGLFGEVVVGEGGGVSESVCPPVQGCLLLIKSKLHQTEKHQRNISREDSSLSDLKR